ncbi:2-hydroxyacid dehydrogenase [Pinisolibacter aquiterrae]|uniref:2-hydroxyacid dehydrogenase n=1 Tax=Pinisolibacter aquiterrae TaxID=2815579 RepID=UPI001C3CC6A9|nr:2-hydroxyacid dehydrogenase [Pinisolibacter aquiterrae]MBV5266177.1 2-hydroxyacid dehydrogenase [Pinisolibacter aquiterrae]MCC8236265.1 2-hydroxyacid dehydrogenase [Pinisolibacter aquiterrae]
MRIAIFSTKVYDRTFLERANRERGHDLTFLEPKLDLVTARLAEAFPAVCVFVNDVLDAAVLERLRAGGTRIVALRAAGYNNVDLDAAARLGLTVLRVPAYSPHGVAEFSVGLLLALDRRIPRAWSRVRENNFALDGLLGHDLWGKTIGIIGTGRIGALVARAFRLGFGCTVLAHDFRPDPNLVAMGVVYTSVDDLVARADVISLHCPLTPQTRHVIDAAAIERAKPGFLLVNTSRGALIDAEAVIVGLKSGKIGGVALDVYEQEADLFFEDLSDEIIQDDVFQRLLTFPNVLVTGHQAFFTEEALTAIAETTLTALTEEEAGRISPNRVSAAIVAPPPASAETR